MGSREGRVTPSPLRPQPFFYLFFDIGRDVRGQAFAVHARQVARNAGGNVIESGIARDKKQWLERGVFLAPCHRDRVLVVKVRAGTQPPDIERRVVRLHECRREPCGFLHADVARNTFRRQQWFHVIVDLVPDHLDALVVSKDRFLAGIDGNQNDQARHNTCRLCDDVEMTAGNGIERPGINAAFFRMWQARHF